VQYKINDNNFINYEILEDFVMVKSIFYDDVNVLFERINHYMDYFSKLENINFLGTFPGTCNPLVISYALDYVRNRKFLFRIFYDGIEYNDTRLFRRNILIPAFEYALTIPSENVLQSACSGAVGIASEKNGFKKCCLFCPLKKYYSYVKTPIRYYEIGADGTFTQEYQEKPIQNKIYYQSIRLKNMFPLYNIVMKNGKINYLPKN
jgi:hypothetical protein